MRMILSDLKIIIALIIVAIIYVILYNGEFNLIGLVIFFIRITISICLFSIIVTYFTNKKYISNLYKYLAISFLGIGIVSISYISIIKNDILDINLWLNSTDFNLIFSIFESFLLIYTFKNMKEKINFYRFFAITLSIAVIISVVVINYKILANYCLPIWDSDDLRIVTKIISVFLKVYILKILIDNRQILSKMLYNNLLIFIISRIMLHICTFIDDIFLLNFNIYVESMLMILSNYYVIKIMVIELIKKPQDFLYKDLIEKTNELETTIKELKRVGELKNIIEDNYDRKTYEDKVRNEILANLSHEFKTPVNVIYAALQTEELNENISDTKSLIKYNSIIKQNCNRLIKLINNFIDVIEFEKGESILNLKYMNIVEVTEAIVDSAVPYAKNKNLTIIFDTTDEMIYGMIDLELYERAILNLLSNAIKYTNIEGEIKVSVGKINNYIEICIEDHGIGISKEYLKIIFNRFERVDKTFSRDTEGTGLGLNIAKEIIELHRGTIEIFSKERYGTKVKVIIPEFTDEVRKDNEEETYKMLTDSIKEKAAIEMSDIYFS